MLCKKPYSQGVLSFSCGQCMPCRLNRRRLWTHRLALENYSHGDSCFVTLTYKPEEEPDDRSLQPKDVQDWLKRLRSRTGLKIRYYLVGEYGDESQRPHYHAALFGIGQFHTEEIGSTWGKGFVFVGDLTEASAAYIAGYVTKKMTSRNDSRLQGRHPEFARMSRRPGIGALSLDPIKQFLTTDVGADQFITTGDVPRQLRHGNKSWPLGRYLREKLRKWYGYSDEAKEELTKRWSEQVCLLHREAQEHPDGPSRGYQLQKDNKQAQILNLESRSKVFKPGGKL